MKIINEALANQKTSTLIGQESKTIVFDSKGIAECDEITANALSKVPGFRKEKEKDKPEKPADKNNESKDEKKKI